MLRRELALECDYQREAACAKKFRCGSRLRSCARGRRRGQWSGPVATSCAAQSRTPTCRAQFRVVPRLGVGRTWAQGVTPLPAPRQGAAEGPPLLLRARDRGRALQPPRADHRVGVGLPPGPGRGAEPGDQERGVSAAALEPPGAPCGDAGDKGPPQLWVGDADENGRRCDGPALLSRSATTSWSCA